MPPSASFGQRELLLTCLHLSRYLYLLDSWETHTSLAPASTATPSPHPVILLGSSHSLLIYTFFRSESGWSLQTPETHSRLKLPTESSPHKTRVTASPLVKWGRESPHTGLLPPKILSPVFNSTFSYPGGGCWTKGYKTSFTWGIFARPASCSEMSGVWTSHLTLGLWLNSRPKASQFNILSYT